MSEQDQEWEDVSVMERSGSDKSVKIDTSHSDTNTRDRRGMIPRRDVPSVIGVSVRSVVSV